MKRLLSKSMIAVMLVGVLTPVNPVYAKTTKNSTNVAYEQSIGETKQTAEQLRAELEAAKADTAKKKTAMYAAYREAKAANEKEKKGSYGFFEEYGYTAACEVLTNTSSSYLSYTKLGQAGDATSLANFKATVSFMKECNTLRAREGVDPQNTGVALKDLKVSMQLMAISQVQGNWSAYHIGHSGLYNVGENLAWGYSDPFAGWYTEEKNEWIRGNRNSDAVGHYLNVCNSDYVVTGFAINQYGSYGVTHEQSFFYATTGTDCMTVTQFASKLNTYCNSIKAARTAYTEAKAAYESALAYQQQLQAQVDALPATYNITYVLNGGTNNSANPSTYQNTSATFALKNPSRVGYAFAGWYSDASYTSRVTRITQGTRGNLTLYAKWSKITVGGVSGLTVTGMTYRRMRVSYRTVSGAVGYQIRYSTSEKMTNARSVYTNDTKKAIIGLKAGQTYYVQVRAYKRDSAGKGVYGNWSQKKSVKAFQ